MELNKSLRLLLLVLALGLFEEALELAAEELVGGLDHGALPHYCGCFDQVAQADVRLGLPVQCLHVLAVLLLGLEAMVKGLFELFQRKVTSCNVSMDYLLS